MTRHLCEQNAPCPSLATALAITLIGLAALHGGAHAGLVSGTLGNVPFYGDSQWAAQGWIRGSEGAERWDVGGSTSDNRTFRPPGEPQNANSVTIDHVLGSNIAGTVSLSSGASARGDLIWGGTTAALRGWSTVSLNDIVYAQTTGGRMAGYIRFDWRVDGTLESEIRSTSGRNIGSHNGVAWATLSSAMVTVSWENPLTRLVTTSVEQSFRSSAVPYSAVPSDEQWYGVEQWGAGGDSEGLALGEVLARGDNIWRETEVIGREAFYGSLVFLPDAMPVAINLRLMTAYNATWHLMDTGDLSTGVYADFSHTATVDSVQLFNPDGTPYVGTWELVSANGIDYPELILPAQASVSAPASLGLLMIGLAGLALRTPRRLTPPA